MTRPLLIALAVLLITNGATGWIAQHAIKERGRAEAAAFAATARADQYREDLERAEAAALVAQQAARQAETARRQAHQKLAELERTQPDVKAWADDPIPAAVLGCLRSGDCD